MPQGWDGLTAETQADDASSLQSLYRAALALRRPESWPKSLGLALVAPGVAAQDAPAAASGKDAGVIIGFLDANDAHHAEVHELLLDRVLRRVTGVAHRIGDELVRQEQNVVQELRWDVVRHRFSHEAPGVA